MLILTLALVLIAFPPSSVVAVQPHAVPKSYVGLIWEPLPKNCRVVGGQAVTESIAEVQLSVELIRCDGVSMLWLNQEIGRTEKRAIKEVKDVVILPRFVKEYGEDVVVTECLLDGRPDFMAIVAKWRKQLRPKEVDGELIATRVFRSWHLDLTAHKFESLPAKRVTCRLPYEALCPR
jgi:hypothetical protein